MDCYPETSSDWIDDDRDIQPGDAIPLPYVTRYHTEVLRCQRYDPELHIRIEGRWWFL